MDGTLTAVTLGTLTGPVDPSTFVFGMAFRSPAVTAGNSYFDGSAAGMSTAGTCHQRLELCLQPHGHHPGRMGHLEFPDLRYIQRQHRTDEQLVHWNWLMQVTANNTHAGMYIQGGAWSTNRMDG